MSPFQRATKNRIKARVALDGPTGSGKTLSSLIWAKELGSRVAVIDTERGRARLYSDRFEFDVAELSPPFSPLAFESALAEADGNYDVVIIDSLSHAWEGAGGVLDIVDAAATRAHGNSFAGWKEGTPALRSLIDRMLALDAHLLVTMRSKMEYILETDGRGKQVPRKVGMAPVMRAGVEYEFDVVADMDLEHRLIVSKSRCSALADQVYPAGKAAEGARTFLAWLNDGDAIASRSEVAELVAAMNALPAEVRGQVKSDFVAAFGRPDTLPASKLAEAQLFVNQRKETIQESSGAELLAASPSHSEPESIGSGGAGDHASPSPLL